MKLMICMTDARGDKAELLASVREMGIGIELQSYGFKGVASEAGWTETLDAHLEIRRRFEGPVAVHGPFLGLVHSYTDHLLRAAVEKRMEITYRMVEQLRPDTLILHTNYRPVFPIFDLVEMWLDYTAKFWRKEIARYQDLGVRVAFENLLEPDPEVVIDLCDRVGHDHFKLCLDIGHTNVWSDLTPSRWVERLGNRLAHVHLHDNHGKTDQHLPVGRGDIDFEAFFDALRTHAPTATVSLEIEADTQTKIDNLKYVRAKYFG